MPDWELEGPESNVGDIVLEPFNLDGFIAADVSVVDETDPVVSLISPEAGTEITRSTPIVVEATDETALATVTIDVTFPDGVCELIYDGTSFRPLYAPGSTVASIENGYRFTLRRARGGWPGTPTFNFEPVDRRANRSS